MSVTSETMLPPKGFECILYAAWHGDSMKICGTRERAEALNPDRVEEIRIR